MVCSGIDLNLRLGSLVVRVVCGAFCLGCGSWVREFWYYMEVPSCTEWKINSAMVSFNPNCYVEVGKEGVDAKVKALSMCRGCDEALSASEVGGVYRGAGCVSWRTVGLDVCGGF